MRFISASSKSKAKPSIAKRDIVTVDAAATAMRCAAACRLGAFGKDAGNLAARSSAPHAR